MGAITSEYLDNHPSGRHWIKADVVSEQNRLPYTMSGSEMHVKPGSHRHRIGWANEGQHSSNFWLKMPDFCCSHTEEVQATPDIRQFPPEFRTLLTFVVPSYPILWRCESGLTRTLRLTRR